MVIQRGNLTWGTTDFSTTELHIPENSTTTNGTTAVSESSDSWPSQQTISVKTEPGNLVEWVREKIFSGGGDVEYVNPVD